MNTVLKMIFSLFFELPFCFLERADLLQVIDDGKRHECRNVATVHVAVLLCLDGNKHGAANPNGIKGYIENF